MRRILAILRDFQEYQRGFSGSNEICALVRDKCAEIVWKVANTGFFICAAVHSKCKTTQKRPTPYLFAHSPYIIIIPFRDNF